MSLDLWVGMLVLAGRRRQRWRVQILLDAQHRI